MAIALLGLRLLELQPRWRLRGAASASSHGDTGAGLEAVREGSLQSVGGPVQAASGPRLRLACDWAAERPILFQQVVLALGFDDPAAVDLVGSGTVAPDLTCPGLPDMQTASGRRSLFEAILRLRSSR